MNSNKLQARVIICIVFAVLAMSGCTLPISKDDKAFALSQCQADFVSYFDRVLKKPYSPTYSLVTFGDSVDGKFRLDFMGTVSFADNAEPKNVDYKCAFLHRPFPFGLTPQNIMSAYVGPPVIFMWGQRGS